MPATPILEIACFSAASARIAEAAGADRIELCEDYAGGGITPSEEMILGVKNSVKIPVQVMIRPRSGSFIYSEAELAEMERSILFCRAHNIEGIVLGVLTEDKQVNVAACRRLIELAGPMSVTFHRAIDVCPDLKRAVQELVSLGVHRVLTSGRGKTALAGLPEISILQKLAGSKICIMPGGGVRASNIALLLASGCREYHSSGITSGPDADAQEITALREVLKQSTRKG